MYYYYYYIIIYVLPSLNKIITIIQKELFKRNTMLQVVQQQHLFVPQKKRRHQKIHKKIYIGLYMVMVALLM